MWRTGVTVGKFNPPHLGHLHLIEVAAARVARLFVILGDRSDQTIPADQRAEWLTDAAPENVTVVITPDDLPAANEPWAARVLDLLSQPPDVAFTSEPWGPGWAAAMGATAITVDQARRTHPVSASLIRADLDAHYRWMVPAARAGLARRVVVVGAESTGKTTLAAALAQRLGTVWVPEHGRLYWEGRRHVSDQRWTTDELRRIARAQSRLEDDLARATDHGIVIADTDPLTTAVWHHRYTGTWDVDLADQARTRTPDLYLVCDADIPWVQDGTRESEAQRDDMHRATLELVDRAGAASGVLSGPLADRVETALSLVAAHCPPPTLI